MGWGRGFSTRPLLMKRWSPRASNFASFPAALISLALRPTRPAALPTRSPSHKVYLCPFYIAVTETTNAQYARFLKATGHPAPLYWEG